MRSSTAAAVAIGAVIGVAVPVTLWLGLVWGVAASVGIGFLLITLWRGDDVDFFSPPVLFTVLWGLCAALGAQIVSVQQRPWNATVWICVIGAPVAFWIGDLLGRSLTASLRPHLIAFPARVAPWPLRPLLVGGLVWWFAAAVLSAWEFKTVLGSVPLLSAEWERVRMVAGGGIMGQGIHAVAYSGILLAMVLQAALFTQPRLFTRATFPLWGLWLMAMGLAALWGSRHTLFFPLAAGVIAFHCLRWRLGITRLLIVAALGMAFLAVVGYVRTAVIWEEQDLAWRQVLADIGYEGWPPLLAQTHQTVAMNFEIFRQLTETFPADEPFRLGAFSFHGIVSLLPGNQPTLAQWQNAHWNTGFYGSLTSTHMGPVYADFGVAGVMLWTAVFALVMRLLFDSLRAAPSAIKVVWFSFLMVQLILMPYDNGVVKLHFLVSLLILWLGMTALGGRRAGVDRDAADGLTAADSDAR